MMEEELRINIGKICKILVEDTEKQRSELGLFCSFTSELKALRL
jgi:hypothetical protein